MGLFSSLKKNINHGGVKVNVEAPDTVNLKSVSFEARVTVSASENLQKINSLSVALQQQAQPGDSGPPMKDITSVNYVESFTLQPGESKTITVQVPLNAGKDLSQTLAAEHPGLAAVADMIGKTEDLANFTGDHSPRRYYLIAQADVDGISMDPAHTIPIQVLRPGEIGGTLLSKHS